MSQRYLGGIITANPTLPTLSSASGVWTLEQDFQNSASITPQVIGRSVRLRASASAYLNRTPASAGTRTAWTMSMWVKRGALGTMGLFSTINSGTVNTTVGFNGDTIDFLEYQSATVARLVTTAVFRDPSAWYHLVFVWDTSNATSTDRVRIYVNGVRMTSFSGPTYPSLNLASIWNNNVSSTIGTYNNGAPPQLYLDGYTSEINFVDGQALTPSSFGAFDSNGIWQPLSYRGTYGTNGFYLNFSDNSAATAAAIGKDYSGNGNNWTPNNISVTAGVTYDSMIDVPTMYADGGNGRGNYCVWNPLSKGASVGLTNGNLDALGTVNTNSGNCVQGTIAVSSGKWYAEFKVTNTYSYSYLGVVDVAAPGTYPGQLSSGYGLEVGTGATYNVSAGPSVTGASAGDTIMVALDMDNGKLWWGKNGTWGGSGNPSAGTGQQYSSLTGIKTFGLSAYSSSGTFNANFGQRPFAYTPPTGFKALNTQNLPDSTIKKGNQYFDVSTWTGTGSSQSIINSGAMQPDFTWVKSRSNAAYTHILQDSVRGVGNFLISAATSAEAANSQMVTSYNSNGFTVNVNGNVNANAETYVGWQWKESASAGFDIVTYTGNGTNGQTVNHSLGVKPAMMIVKLRSGADNWTVYHQSMGATKGIQLNQTAALQTLPGYWNNTEPTSSAFTLGTYSVANGSTFVAYLFSEVAGYSKFGSYTGNGSTDGPFVYCGFRPRYVMIKRSDGAEQWMVYDSARDTYNVETQYLSPNSSAAEAALASSIDFVSNGFKVRYNSSPLNLSSGTYIYACFAENPFNISRAR